MNTKICNSCGQPLRTGEVGYKFKGQLVCPRCAKKLNPKGFAATKAAERKAAERKESGRVDDKRAREDAKYRAAKRRVIFFLNGCISFFWLIVLLNLILFGLAVYFATGFGG